MARPSRSATPATPAAPATALAEDIADLTHSPLGHALYAYPWGSGPLADEAGPRRWQRDVLSAIGEHLADPARRHLPCRIARASGHGIGKSALIAMIVKWALDTCEDTRIVITANTESQLLTKTAPGTGEMVQPRHHRRLVPPDRDRADLHRAGPRQELARGPCHLVGDQHRGVCRLAQQGAAAGAGV